MIDKEIAMENKRAMNNISKWGEIEKETDKYSNMILESDDRADMKLQEFIWRTRVNESRLPGTQFEVNASYETENRENMNRSLRYNTPECFLCGMKAICDLTHLWVCEGMKKEKEKFKKQIRTSFDKIGKDGKNRRVVPGK